MKNLTITILLSVLTHCATAQGKRDLHGAQTDINAHDIEVCYRKTTSLIFASAIKTVDRGSDDIIVQKADGVENVLRVKANTERFRETNLSVITADGQFYTFNVNYAEKPLTLAVKIAPILSSGPERKKATVPIKFAETSSNTAEMKKLAAQASITPRNIRNVYDKAYDAELRLTGLYLNGDYFFYKFMLSNKSLVSYHIGSLQFFIADRKQVKRTATQQIQVKPLMIIGNLDPIKGRSDRMLIAVLPKQTITSDKILTAELQETNGGRNLRCGIRSSTLLKAKPISVTTAVDNIPNVLSSK